MNADNAGPNENVMAATREIAELRGFSGPPKEFWSRYINALAALASATKVVLLRADGQAPGQWKKLTEWSANLGSSRFHTAFINELEQVASRCVQDGPQIFPLEPSGVTNHFIVAARLKLHRPEEICVAACLLSEMNKTQAEAALVRIGLAADTAELYQKNLASEQAKADVEKLASVMDTMVQVNAETRFLAAAMAVCNGLATRYACDRVSLGWLEGGFIKLRAISRTEKFDRQMAAGNALESAMEEALDQDEEVLWPRPAVANFVTRDHEKYAKELNLVNICSVPLRLEGKAVAVVTCERGGSAFTPTELQQMRLCADQVVRRLSDLKHQDRWFGARWAFHLRGGMSKVLGPEHTWAKVLAALIAAALMVLCFLRVPYRVEGNFILRSDEVAYLTAPFDGYISRVDVRPGDTVAQAASLVSLNTTELELEESAARADLNRFQREAEKARATNALAEMRVALALSDQAKARLDLVQYRLQQAALKAPFAAVVVEGDIREKLGAPVKQGEAILKVARTDALYVEAEVKERDVHEILGKANGEIAFVSQPKLKYPVRIVTVEPAAVPKNEANVFLVRCAFVGKPEAWWRPGMSGLCKIDVEKRSLLWVLSHRTIDFLRMKLWW